MDIPSKNSDFTLRVTGNYDVSKIQDLVLEYSSIKWEEDQTRQNAAPDVHNETNAIVVREISNSWSKGEPFEPNTVTSDQRLLDLIDPIIKDHELMYDGIVGKVVFIKLPAGGRVNDHYDNGDYLSMVRRHHVPILTNELVKFRVANNVVNMKPGECWEINNSKMHGVVNLGSTDRVHMLFDIMPREMIV